MTKDSKIAVLGNPLLAGQIKAALRAEGFEPINEGDLEIQDEWQVNRWFLEQNPTHVFICVGVRGQTSVADFLATMVGTINLLKGAVSFTRRVRLVTTLPTVEYYQLRRLCELYFFEKELDYADILYAAREKPQEYFRRCVLSMRDISAKEAHAHRAQGKGQGRQVPEQVVPQREGGPIHELPQPKREGDPLREPPQSLLEVPGANAQGAPPGDLRPQRDPPAGQATAHSFHDHLSPVQGVVS